MKKSLTLAGLCLGAALSAQTFTTYTTLDGLPSDNVRDLAVGPDGALWMATQAGVVRYNGVGFETHNTTTHPGLASDDVQAIGVAANGEVWAGTDFGVSVYDGASYVTYTTADGLSDDQVKNIKQAPNGDVWIATINGATRYSGGVFTAFGSPEIPFGGVLHLAFAPNGDVWMSGGLSGVIVYDGTAFSTITTAQGLISNRIRAIAFDDAENKWVATAEGISVLDADDQHLTDHAQVFLLPPPDELNPITDVLVADNGLVWAGVYVDYLVTEGGVSVYDGSAWQQFETSDGLAGPNVRRLVVDGDGDVWVATSTGVTEISNISIGIAEREASQVVVLHPNPANEQLGIHVAGGAFRQGVSVSIYDAGMRLVLTAALMGDRATVDVSGLDAGVYVAQVAGVVQRFVVQH